MPSHLDMKRGGSPSPASHSDLLLLWGRVVALGLSFHFPVAGQRVAAWCGLDSITSVVLARFPPTQVDTRSTPQLREHRHKGCTHVTGPSSASQTCLDSASGQGPLLALPCLLPSQASLTFMVGSFSTRGRQYTGTGTFFIRVSSWPPLGLSCNSGREALWERGLGRLRFGYPSFQMRAEAVDPPYAPTPPSACTLRPAAPACTWPAGSSRRPAAAHRRCARARAPGGIALASAPAGQRRCSRWASERNKGVLLSLW